MSTAALLDNGCIIFLTTFVILKFLWCRKFYLVRF